MTKGLLGQARGRSAKEVIPFSSDVVVWLDPTAPATSIVSGAVATLGDRSGNGRHVTQALDTKRPLYTASDPDFGGRPSMTFDGVDDFLTLAGLPAWPQLTLAVVAHGGTSSKRYVAYAGTGGGGSGGSVLIQQDTSTQLQSTYFNAASTGKIFTTIAGATRRIVSAFDTSVGAVAVSALFVDGVASGAHVSTGAVNGPIATSATLSVGANVSGTTTFFDDKIAEVIIWDRALSGDEIEVVDEWLRARYVIPPYFNNVQLWLDLTSPDTSIVDGAVATLGDRSGNGRHHSQVTGTRQPAYNPSDPDFGGRPSMTGDGIDDALSAASWAFPGNTATWFFVTAGAASVPVATGRVFEHGRMFPTYHSTAVIRATFGSTGDTIRSVPIVAGTPHVIAFVYDATTASTAVQAIYRDGVEVSTLVASLATVAGLTNATSHILNRADTTRPGNGTVADIIAYAGALTAPQIAAVTTWLTARYKL